MTTALESFAEPAVAEDRSRQYPEGTSTMYAIVFDMDTESLKENYPGESWQNAYADIKRVLKAHGFDWQQGSVYFGNEEVNAVTCVMAAVDLARSHAWFQGSVRDIRMLRIEEKNNLMPAVENAGEGPNLFNR